MGFINAMEELVTGYLGGYMWLVGPFYDVSLFTIVYLSSAHLEEETHATFVVLSHNIGSLPLN